MIFANSQSDKKRKLVATTHSMPPKVVRSIFAPSIRIITVLFEYSPRAFRSTARSRLLIEYAFKCQCIITFPPPPQASLVNRWKQSSATE